MKRLAILLLPLLCACSAARLHADGMAQMAAGRTAEGVAKLEQAARAAPEELAYRGALLRARETQQAEAQQASLTAARAAQAKGDAERLVEPQLASGQEKPVNLEFRDANVKLVFEALSRSTGVNFILDKDVRADLRTTVFLRQSALEDAIELILQTCRLEKKVLNRNTVLIYPNTPEKQKDYQELALKAFYLANADVKQTQAMLRALLKTRDIFIDERLNLLLMRDTAESIRLAEKLVALQDINEPEVMLEVEVLEVRRARLLELGVQWPGQATFAPLGSDSALTLADLKALNAAHIGVGVGSAALNLRRELGDANILANPRIRVRNREKAKILVGDKVPVSSAVTTATGVVSESVQYLDVGIKLEVEPLISLEDEVAIRTSLEVSAISSQVRTPAGSLAYQIGTRSASTVLRLKNGETQVLAGLINDEDRSAASRIPGLGDIPLLGRLFGSQKDERNKTEVVLSITPRLVRNIVRPPAAASEFWSGTESALRTRPLVLGAPLPVTQQAGATAVDKKEPSDSTNVTLAWQGPAVVKRGEVFQLALQVKAEGALRALPLQLGFDPAVLQVAGVAEGSFFGKAEGGASLSSNVDAAGGKIYLSALRAGAEGASGSGSAAVLNLRALKATERSELKLLGATPLAANGAALAPALPAPFAVKVDD